MRVGGTEYEMVDFDVFFLEQFLNPIDNQMVNPDQIIADNGRGFFGLLVLNNDTS